ncbi:hypothetical protein SGRIM128S_08615 [Streptomyces griseomycini]
MWWGVAAALSANVLYSGGFVLEKRALAALPEVTARRPARLLRLVLGSPLWIGGALALAAGFAAQLRWCTARCRSPPRRASSSPAWCSSSCCRPGCSARRPAAASGTRWAPSCSRC